VSVLVIVALHDPLKSTREAVLREEYDNGPSSIFYSEVNSLFGWPKFFSNPTNYISGHRVVECKFMDHDTQMSL
jgi:hypothetical protein